MDRELIIQLVQETIFDFPNEDPFDFTFKTLQQRERFAALVAAHEREECARVCGRMVDAEYKTGKVDHNEMGWTQACAIAIRSRT